MAKFGKGDKVRVFKGVHEGTTGVVADPCWQVSQSDWPRVEFTTEDGMYFYADEDEMELTEDPYEYAVQIITGPRAGDLVPLWSDRKDRQDFIDDLYAYSDAHSYKLVKRLKAGPVIDA